LLADELLRILHLDHIGWDGEVSDLAMADFVAAIDSSLEGQHPWPPLG
jgi:hypothetical protein